MTLEDLCREKVEATEAWRNMMARNVAGITIKERVEQDLASDRAYRRMIAAEGAYLRALRESP